MNALSNSEWFERITLAPAAVRQAYQQRIQEHIETLRTKLSEGGVAYHLFNTSTPLDFALFTYLSHRQKAARVR